MKAQLEKMKKELEAQEEVVSKQASKIQELETRLQGYDGIKNKLAQQEQILDQYQKSNELLQKSLSEHEKIIKIFEKKLQIFAKISVEVESYHTIKGTINIVEGLNKLDKQRSKYILNTNGSRMLGEKEYQNGTQITSLTQNISINSKSLGTFFLHALIVDENGKTDEIISEPLLIKTSKFIFDYTGNVQSVKLSSGTYKLEVWGSSGGENNVEDNRGYIYIGYAGKGGYSVGTLKLSKETTLYVYVGGTSNSTEGGWNGGGSGRLSAAGGGSTDISLYGKEGSTEWNTNDHLYSRIIVAGGGGGSSSTQYAEWQGGCGGGSDGENSGENQAKGGSQTSGHSFGAGLSITISKNSAGGGGWYGGYGHNNGGYGRGGGGGSGFVYTSSTASNYPNGCKLNSSFYLSNSATISGKDEFPTTSGTGTERGHSGNGYAVITLH